MTELPTAHQPGRLQCSGAVHRRARRSALGGPSRRMRRRFAMRTGARCVVVCIALPWMQGRQVPTTDATVVPESVFLLARRRWLRRHAGVDAGAPAPVALPSWPRAMLASAGGGAGASAALAGGRADTSRSPPLRRTGSRPVQRRRRVASGTSLRGRRFATYQACVSR